MKTVFKALRGKDLRMKPVISFSLSCLIRAATAMAR
jgi:hypothetical protein